MECENCGNEHDGSYGSGRFCSEHCRRQYSTRIGNLHRKEYPKPWNKGKQTIGHPHTKETREKLSIIRSKILEREDSGGFKNVKWYHVSNLDGKDYVVRGTWELTIAKLLNEHGLSWVKNKHLPYLKEGVRRTYNPDFYLPNTDEYIEVKGYYSEKDKIKMRLVLEQHEGVKIYMIGSKEFPMFKERKLWLNDKLLLQNA